MAKHICPQSCSVDGNNGGSYVTMRDDGREGFVYLEVGETCVRTVQAEISVVALAAILTWAEEYGFEKILEEYGYDKSRGWACDDDPILWRNRNRKPTV